MRGFGLIDLLIVFVVFGVLAGLAIVLLPGPQSASPERIECMNTVSKAVGLAAVAQVNTPGPDDGRTAEETLRKLLQRVSVAGEEIKVIVRCPGDESRTLISYVVHDHRGASCGAPAKPFILIADDSIDHHETGLVVGYSDGSVKFREYPPDTVVGRASQVAELRCLRKD